MYKALNHMDYIKTWHISKMDEKKTIPTLKSDWMS